MNKSEAYFGQHTDVTIPYSELGDITAICDNGKFVLPGTEELNIEGM